MQWLTSKTPHKAVTALGGAPMRNSTMNDADMVRKYPVQSVLVGFLAGMLLSRTLRS